MAVFRSQVVAFFTSLALIIAGFLGINIDLSKNKVDDFRVTTYVRGDYIQSPDSLHPEDFDIITDVILFECASFNSAGEVVYDEKKLETALNNLRDAIGDRDIHLTLNLLGPSGNTDSTVWEEQMEAQSDEHNKAFLSGVLEDNIVAVLDRYGFDGVHFDYEYPLSSKAWKHFNNFLVSLDKKLGSYTLGVSASTWNIKFTTRTVGVIDSFELMIYDMVDEEGKHATFEDTIESARTVGIYGIPLSKANIGLAFYSRPADMSAYWYGYNGCADGIDENGWYHCEETGKDFWFNTPDVIEKKTEYAIKNGFGGVMIWHYSCDLPSWEEGSLLRAVDTALKNN